jgi:hypothetical protein
MSSVECDVPLHDGVNAVRGLVVIVLFVSSIWCRAEEASPKTQLGVAHLGGRYAFSSRDYLNEGGITIRSLGARCIKVSLSLDTDNPSPKLYPFHSTWPEVSTLEALADSPYYRALFALDFDTFILTSFLPAKPAGYWRDRFTDTDERAEEDCFAALAGHLLRTYADSNKTFVLQNWEGDWALRGSFDPSSTPTRESIDNMARWLAARQRGVARARRTAEASRARVFHACEVNLVLQAADHGAPSVTVDVLPHVPVDLVSYSAWDTRHSPKDFGRALGFIAKYKRPTAPFGERGVYIGEFGLPESDATPEKVLEKTRALMAEIERFGCPYAVYWQLYCNEPVAKEPKANSDFKGFWLVRPDGTRSPVCELFK